MKSLVLLMVVLSFCLSGTACEGEKKNDRPGEANGDDTAAGVEIPLPSPELQGSLSVEEAVYASVSRRNYGDESLNLAQAGQLLWAAGGLGIDGITGASRTAPSAGATYPLEIYLVAGEVEDLPAGIYRYNYAAHSLEKLRQGDRRAELAGAALGQDVIARAPMSIVMAAIYERTTGRYGDRGVRYVHMDAGYASQNVYLQAESLNLATVAIGAFDDDAVQDILSIDEAPLMIMPVGTRNSKQ